MRGVSPRTREAACGATAHMQGERIEEGVKHLRLPESEERIGIGCVVTRIFYAEEGIWHGEQAP